MRTWILVLGGVAAIGAAIGYWMWLQHPPNSQATDPRLSYKGPFRNVHPDVAYVSDETCAECHPKEANTYRHHPMARTLIPVAALALPPLSGKVNNPFDALGQHFEVDAKPGSMWHVRSAMDG